MWLTQHWTLLYTDSGWVRGVEGVGGGGGKRAELLLCDKGSVLHHRRFPHWPRSSSATTPTASNSGPERSAARPGGADLHVFSPSDLLSERGGDPPARTCTVRWTHDRALTWDHTGDLGEEALDGPDGDAARLLVLYPRHDVLDLRGAQRESVMEVTWKTIRLVDVADKWIQFRLFWNTEERFYWPHHLKLCRYHVAPTDSKATILYYIISENNLPSGNMLVSIHLLFSLRLSWQFLHLCGRFNLNMLKIEKNLPFSRKTKLSCFVVFAIFWG